MTFYETPLLTEARKKILHARICPKETYTQKEFVEHVAMFQHPPKKHYRGGTGRLHRRTVRPVCQRQHCRTRRVGIFSTSLKCTQDTDDEKKKIRSESVRFQNVHLRISKHIPQENQTENETGKDTFSD